MGIVRIDSYEDSRFPKNVLYQHGAYLVDDEPYHIEIVDFSSAIVRGKHAEVYQALIDEFRFHAPHIIRFYDEHAALVAEYPMPDLMRIETDRIQPSQFFIDEDKLKAVRTFVRKPEDVIIQVIRYGDRYISLDGHTRFFMAVQNGFDAVMAVESEADDWVWVFVHEAERRNILRPGDMILLPHEAYDIQWNQYCDAVFSGQ